MPVKKKVPISIRTQNKNKRRVPLFVRILIIVFAVVFIFFMIVSLIPFGPYTQKPKESTAAPQGASESLQSGDDAQNYIAGLLDQVQKEPGNVMLLTELGNALFDAGKYQDAIIYYGKVLEITPDNNFVRTDMGIAYFFTGDPERAIDEFNKVLEMDPEFKHAIIASAVVYEKTGDYEKAIEFYQRFLEVAPDDPSTTQVKQRINELQDLLK
jgi:tetratricopeptide (TPR) repeat protein